MHLRYRILGLEDSPSMRAALEEAAPNYSKQYVGFEGWADFKAALDTQGPWGLLLMDRETGIHDGAQLSGILKRAYKDLALPPIVLFSSTPPEQLEQIARECDADGWITKGPLNDLFFEKLDEVYTRTHRQLR